MITFLSGGTGTPKLLRGMRNLVNDDQIAVIVNTAEDMWVSGNHMSPDIDTVLYLFAGLLNTDTWWGIRGDTFSTHKFLEQFTHDEFIGIGDKDRAVHIARARMLWDGATLTGATAALAGALGVQARVLPMTDAEVTTYVETPEGPMHFQQYWVGHRGEVPIEGVIRKGEAAPKATPEALTAIREADAVIIGPSNPVTSISPILECAGVREVLKDQFVIAVSPFIGDRPVSGPAAALMEAWGMEPSSAGTYELYKDFVDVFVQDRRDETEVPGAMRLDTLMSNEGKAEALAWELMAVVRSAVQRRA
ncbi:2-phospho-L-lactate transferase [Methanofollis aquaemaris]|uniref:2-phospho-L-lactate transferase n=1 Tax=Methanofollis aquaemaris TaxID=126734 RepID=A0A8A3S6I2_9EURY|nr:2-phospho-L-lactate transferase [Methanofollis aquaemaris]QSZ67216.1 2-phospho-L-lactate transferase [Methanofollis aquaemaris]